MINLRDYLQDGAGYQSRAVLAYLQIMTIEESWSAENRSYEATVQVARWENCREQGYIVSLRSKDFSRQLNIAFFEHRNSDSICAVRWEQVSGNTITLETAVFGEVYKDKWDVSHSVGYGEVDEMSTWIVGELTQFWSDTTKK
jgi:hypothetical protein